MSRVRALWFMLAFQVTGPLVRMVMQIAVDMRCAPTLHAPALHTDCMRTA